MADNSGNEVRYAFKEDWNNCHHAGDRCWRLLEALEDDPTDTAAPSPAGGYTA